MFCAANPVNARDPSGLAPNVEYIDRDKAVHDALIDCLDYYNKNGGGVHEWGTLVYQRPNGRYIYPRPTKGKEPNKWEVPWPVYEERCPGGEWRGVTTYRGPDPSLVDGAPGKTQVVENWYVEAICHVHPTKDRFSGFGGDQTTMLGAHAPIYLIHAPTRKMREMTKESQPYGTPWECRPGK